jgi:UDP-N-acetylglucosamine--N-acetylmuramyl-(pentapeptide) pyrophosphoryl-undecaprenol N-acetylglucosamine transferase
MRIVLTGGGSGGHFYPLLAVIRELRAIAEQERILNLELLYLGPLQPHEKKLLEEEMVKVIPLRTGKLRRYWSFLNIFDIFFTIQALVKGIWELFWLYPDVIFSKGGHGSFPAVVGSWLLKIPLIIHESDVVPGKVNTFAKKFAKRIAISFPESAHFFPPEKVALTGLPLRKDLFGGDRELAATLFGIGGEKPITLILGGSQGAQAINELIIQGLRRLLTFTELIHQTGEKNFKEVQAEGMAEIHSMDDAEKTRWHTLPFLDETELRAAYLLADVIISRASSTIFEIALTGKPSILIPLPDAAQDHQRKNAYAYARAGACTVIEQENLTPNILIREIEKILENKELAARLGEGAKKFAKPDASETIAREILRLAITH